MNDLGSMLVLLRINIRAASMKKCSSTARFIRGNDRVKFNHTDGKLHPI